MGIGAAGAGFYTFMVARATVHRRRDTLRRWRRQDHHMTLTASACAPS
jgi:hypothetical protein